MKLKNILIIVKDIDLSKAFYKELFGLQVITDFGDNVILSEGLVLQEKNLWEQSTGRKVVSGGNDAELYFETYDLDSFVEKLENSRFEVTYINKLMEPVCEQRVIRIYDPDEHIIEIKESRK